MKTKKLKCDCSNQKETVHNLTMKGKNHGMSVWRCIKCVNEKTSGAWTGM